MTADTETRELVSRETTIKATDKTRVLGTASLLAGAIQQVSAGDFDQAVKGNVIVTVGGNAVSDIVGQAEINVGQSLIEKVGNFRSSVAAARQEVIAPVVWVGSKNVNVLQLMLETLDVVKQLAELTASHTHNNTGTPLNATSFTVVGTGAIALKTKYYPIIS